MKTKPKLMTVTDAEKLLAQAVTPRPAHEGGGSQRSRRERNCSGTRATARNVAGMCLGAFW